MRILFVARHDGHEADDEGAITFALRKLGHEVVCINEQEGKDVLKMDGDFVLFLKWGDVETIKKIDITKVCWFFDKVQFGARLGRVKPVLQAVDYAFLTDGEFVKQCKEPNVVCLRQGIDERSAYFVPTSKDVYCDIVFVGQTYSPERQSFFSLISNKYGDMFSAVQQCYQSKLSVLFGRTKCVVAPDSPNNDDYWSNRVYVTLGHGGFLLHPYCSELAKEFEDGKHLAFYRSRDELLDKLDYYLNNDAEREQIRRAGYERCLNNFSYTHRCQTLLSTLQKNIGSNA